MVTRIVDVIAGLMAEYGVEHVAFRENPGKAVVVSEQCTTLTSVLHRPDYITYVAGLLHYQWRLQFQRQYANLPQAALKFHDGS